MGVGVGVIVGVAVCTRAREIEESQNYHAICTTFSVLCLKIFYEFSPEFRSSSLFLGFTAPLLVV